MRKKFQKLLFLFPIFFSLCCVSRKMCDFFFFEYQILDRSIIIILLYLYIHVCVCVCQYQCLFNCHIFPICDQMFKICYTVYCEDEPNHASHSLLLESIESATNELPLSAISFKRCPSSPEREKCNSKSSFDAYYAASEMSLMATNERPLSCTCLPKLLTEHDISLIISESSPPSGVDDEFNYTEPILSSSCPLPYGSQFNDSESPVFSANFIERLNDYKEYRRQRKSLTPQIFVTDAEPKITNLKAMRTASLPIPDMAPHSDNNEMPIKSLKTCSTNLLPILAINIKSMHANKLQLSEPNISTESKLTTNIQLDNHNRNLKCLDSISKIKSTNLPILLSDGTSISINNKKQSKSKSNASSASANNLTNINNTTIPHPNIVKTHNSDATQSTTHSTTRRQRHSIAGQMLRIMDIAGGFSSRKMTSTNSLFSTAVISGSSSAPNLHQINTASPSGIIVDNDFESNIFLIFYYYMLKS